MKIPLYVTLSAMRKCPLVSKPMLYIPLPGKRFGDADPQCQVGSRLICRAPLWGYTDIGQAEAEFFVKNPDGTENQLPGTVFAVTGKNKEDVCGFSDGSPDLVVMQPDIEVVVTEFERGEDGIDFISLEQDRTNPPLFEEVFPTLTKEEMLRRAVTEMESDRTFSREEEEDVYKTFEKVLEGEKEGTFPEGEFYKGLCLFRGFGVFPDKEQGTKLIEIAARSNFPPAIKMIAGLSNAKIAIECLQRCHDDEALKKRLAIELFMKTSTDIFTAYESLSHRDSDGWVCMAICYYLGRGIGRDYSKSFVCFKRAAKDFENPHGMNNLAVSFIKGYGTAADMKRALKWFKKASDKGNLVAKVNLARAKLLEDNSDTSAFHLLKDACVKDCPEAHYLMSLCYKNGMGGVERNQAIAKVEAGHAKKLGFNRRDDLNTLDWFLSVPGKDL